MFKFIQKILNKKTKNLRKDKLYYLASPYTHISKVVEKRRLNEISLIAAKLLDKDIKGIYPISSSAEVAKHMSNKTNFEHWAELDFMYVERCDGIIIANLPGWKTSTGVTAEIKHAKKLNLPVFILNSKDLIKNNKLNVRRVF